MSDHLPSAHEAAKDSSDHPTRAIEKRRHRTFWCSNASTFRPRTSIDDLIAKGCDEDQIIGGMRVAGCVQRAAGQSHCVARPNRKLAPAKFHHALAGHDVNKLFCIVSVPGVLSSGFQPALKHRQLASSARTVDQLDAEQTRRMFDGFRSIRGDEHVRQLALQVQTLRRSGPVHFR